MYNVIMTQINEILKKNLEYIGAYDANLCGRLMTVNAINPSIQLVYTEKNEANLVINNYPINEQTGAQDEADRIISSLSHNNTHSIHVVMGMGFGYLFSAIVEKSKGSVILYEPNLELLRVALEMVDMSAFLSKARVFVTDSLDMLETHFSKSFLPCSKTAVLGCYYYRVNRSNGLLNGLIQKLGVLQSIYETNAKQRAKNGYHYAHSVCWNLDELEQCKPISCLKDSLKNLPAVITASGPSLGDNLDVLKKYRDKFVLFGVSSSFATLMKNDIKPDFVSIIEEFDSTGLVKGFPLDDICLITEPYLNKNVLKLPFKEKYISPSIENSANSIYNRAFDVEPFYFETKGTVAYNALYSAMYMGCNPIILVGQDLAYVDGECYSKNSLLSPIKCRKVENRWEVYVSDIEQLKKNLFSHKEVDDEVVSKNIEKRIQSLNNQMVGAKTKFGEDVATSVTFNLFAEYYKSFAKQYSSKINLYNTTKKGVDIGDFEYLPLENLLKDLGDINVEICEDVNKNKTSLNLEFLNREISSLEKITDEINLKRDVFLEMRNLLSQGKFFDKTVIADIKILLNAFLSINQSAMNSSLIYNELTFETQYALGLAFEMLAELNEDVIKHLSHKLKIFYSNDYWRLVKGLSILKYIKKEVENENCFAKS